VCGYYFTFTGFTVVYLYTEVRNLVWSVFEKGMLWGIFALKGKEWQEDEEDCETGSFIICTLRQILLG
jgi:hypothetical protein